MLDSLTLLRAMNGIHEEDVIMAGNTYSEHKRTRFKTKRILTLALAAALLLALGAGAWAAGMISGPKEAERVALEQIGVWKDLGLLSQEIRVEAPASYIHEEEAREGGDYWYGRLFPHCYDVRFSDGKHFCLVNVDTLTGKIVYATISAKPDETDKPVATEVQEPVDVNDPEKGFTTGTVCFYENFDDIFPPDLTVDRFCSLLAEYWGFSGYRIADTVDEVWYDAHWEAIDGATLLKDLPKVNPTNYYLTVFFEGDQEGAPMYVQLGNFPGYVAINIGNHHGVG